jgi:hypothetical protein
LNDLSQYPVFPGVISDYTSEKLDLSNSSVYRDLTTSIAAINQERLQPFIDNFDSMNDPLEKCLFRSHYSNSAYVIGFLIRHEPYTTMHKTLQSGHFDDPNRLFYSIPECWDSVNNTQGDYRELIPQFFSSTRFLINSNHHNMGVYGNGKPVNDVVLPNWAKTPHEFIQLNSLALESEFVSEKLNAWIDLIFGIHQNSFDHHNVFHPYCSDECLSNPIIFNDETNLMLALKYALAFGGFPENIFRKRQPNRIIKTPSSRSLNSFPNSNYHDLVNLKQNSHSFPHRLTLMPIVDPAFALEQREIIEKEYPEELFQS